MPYLVCLITAPSARTAETIAKKLIKERLAACVNIVPVVKSYFHWKGKLEIASEALLIVKTTKTRFDSLKQRVQEIHPYTVPEIIALGIVKGNESYLNWVGKTLG